MEVEVDGDTFMLNDGDVVIAAITSCTNTSNPDVMVGAGLVARRARELGLARKPWVKSSFAPGSKVVTEYLTSSGLLDDLEALGFYIVGYGCTTCIGNSGPLPEPISAAVNEGGLVVASVLSGNRNFEGRIPPEARANYLASPPLVVAYAIAGTVDWDPTNEPMGQERDGRDVFLRDIWPSQQEVAGLVGSHVNQGQFYREYADVFTGSDEWRAINTPGRISITGTGVHLHPGASVLRRPRPRRRPDRARDRCPGAGQAGRLGHHRPHQPGGTIKPTTPAGQYLIAEGVQPAMFNSYGSRRGNDRVMTRGTFANIRVRNDLAPATEGGWTTDFLDGEVKSIYEAAMHYQEAGVPLIVIAGRTTGWGRRGTGRRRAPSCSECAPYRQVFRADPPLQPRDDGGASAHLPRRTGR